MKRFTAFLLFLAATFLGQSMVFAQGEAAVPFLVISPGARNGGMGEAGVAYAHDANAVYWNPAGLAFQYQNPETDKVGEISFMHSKWLPQFNFEDLYYDYLAARYYIEDLGTVGGSITYLNLGKNVWTDENGAELGTFDSYEYAFTLSYAAKIQENLGAGVNLKLIHSQLSDVTVGSENDKGIATTFAVDLGMLWTPATPILRNRLNLGFNLSNMGPKITYIDREQADPLPTNLRLGLSYKLYDDEFNRIHVLYDVNRLLVRKYKDGDSDDWNKALFTTWGQKDSFKRFSHSIGMEYWYGNLIALRTGYFYEDKNYGDRKFLTFGAGLMYADMFGFDFGYISAAQNHPLSDTMRFSVSVDF